jgi:hypothetical protein
MLWFDKCLFCNRIVNSQTYVSSQAESVQDQIWKVKFAKTRSISNINWDNTYIFCRTKEKIGLIGSLYYIVAQLAKGQAVCNSISSHIYVIWFCSFYKSWDWDWRRALTWKYNHIIKLYIFCTFNSLDVFSNRMYNSMITVSIATCLNTLILCQDH